MVNHKTILYEDPFLQAFVFESNEICFKSINKEGRYDFMYTPNVPRKNIMAMWRVLRDYVKNHPECWMDPLNTSNAIKRLKALKEQYETIS